MGGSWSIIKPGGATDKQIDLLVKLGVNRATATGYSVRQAGAVISNLKETRCTTKQASYLRYLGCPHSQIDGMNYEAASKEIESRKGAVA